MCACFVVMEGTHYTCKHGLGRRLDVPLAVAATVLLRVLLLLNLNDSLAVISCDKMECLFFYVYWQKLLLTWQFISMVSNVLKS